MKKIICKIFRHNFKYNFPSLPNKCICHRCYIKLSLNLRTLEWEEITEFNKDLGTDRELTNRWF